MNVERSIQKKLLEMMETKPFYRIRVNDLVKEIGISRGTFYFYYDSIENALHTIEEEFIDGLPDEQKILELYESRKSKTISTQQLLSYTAHYLEKNLDTFRILSGENGSSSFQRRMIERNSSILNKFFGSNMPPVQRTLAIRSASGSQWALYCWWANEPDRISADEMARQMNALLMEKNKLVNFTSY